MTRSASPPGSRPGLDAAARARWGAVAALLALAALEGCGGERDVAQKQLEDLRAEIVKLRADSAALGERVEALELARGTFRPAPPASAAPEDRPALDVVRLAPDGEAPRDDDADGDDARPALRSGAAGAVVQETPKAGGSAQDDYDRALSLYRARSYDKAIEAFGQFLARYPDHQNADNAAFWRGECLLQKLEYRRAAEQLETVVSTYPKGNKAPDALLKLVQTYGKLGDKDRADAARQKLLSTYPTSEAAKKLSAKTASPKK